MARFYKSKQYIMRMYIKKSGEKRAIHVRILIDGFKFVDYYRFAKSFRELDENSRAFFFQKVGRGEFSKLRRF